MLDLTAYLDGAADVTALSEAELIELRDTARSDALAVSDELRGVTRIGEGDAFAGVPVEPDWDSNWHLIAKTYGDKYADWLREKCYEDESEALAFAHEAASRGMTVGEFLVDTDDRVLSMEYSTSRPIALKARRDGSAAAYMFALEAIADACMARLAELETSYGELPYDETVPAERRRSAPWSPRPLDPVPSSLGVLPPKGEHPTRTMLREHGLQSPVEGIDYDDRRVVTRPYQREHELELTDRRDRFVQDRRGGEPVDGPSPKLKHGLGRFRGPRVHDSAERAEMLRWSDLVDRLCHKCPSAKVAERHFRTVSRYLAAKIGERGRPRDVLAHIDRVSGLLSE